MSTITITSLDQPEAQSFLDEIDFVTLIPAVIDLIKMVQAGTIFTDLQRTFAIIMQIVASLQKAEESASVKVDWGNFLDFFFNNILPILIGLFGEQDKS